MTQTSRLVLEIDSRDAEQKAADVRKALGALADAGLSIKPAMDKARDGMESMGKGADKASKSIEDEREEIEQLLSSIDPLTRKMNELEKQELALAKARKSGKIDLDTYNDYQAKLTSTRSALTGFSSDLNKTGMSAKANAAALRGVPAQFTDIFTSIAAGQPITMVALQQGGQLKDTFGGIGPAAKALGGYVLGLVNPFTVAAAAAAGLGIAYYQGSKEADAYRNALINTGNSAGTTAGALSSMASSIGGTVGTTGEAAAALALLAENGKIARGSFEEIATAAVASQEATGKAVSETIAEFAKIAEDPVKAAKTLNDQYNFLTTSVYNQIVALKEQGRETEAARILTDSYADAVRSRATQVTTNLGSIERAWAAISLETRKTIDSVLNVGRLEDTAKKITDLTQKVAAAQSAINANPDDTDNQKKLAASKAELAYMTQQRDTQAAIAAAEALSAENQRKGIAATAEFNTQLKSGANNAEKRAEAIKVLNKQIADAVKADAPLADKDIARRIADINEQFKDPAVKKELEYREDAGQKMLDNARQQYAVLQQQGALISQQADSTKTLGTEAKKLIELEQQIADIKTKQTLTADQKSILAMAELNIAQQKRNADLEKEVELKKQSTEETRKLAAFQENLNSQLELAREGLSNQLAGFGMGDKARQRLQEDLKIQQSYQKQMNELTKSFNESDRGEFSQDRYDKETDMIKAAMAERLAAQQGYYQDLDSLQSDWTNGASAAWQDYVDEANDIAGQTYSAFRNAFDGLEDSLTSFVTGGKLSFKDLADSIIADIARIIIKTQVVTPLLNSLFGSGGGNGSSSFGGAIGSILGGGNASDSNGWGGMVGLGKNLYSAWSNLTGVGSSIASGYASGGVSGAISGGAGYYGNMLSNIATTLGSGFTSLIGGNIAITGATAAGTAATTAALTGVSAAQAAAAAATVGAQGITTATLSAAVAEGAASVGTNIGIAGATTAAASSGIGTAISSAISSAAAMWPLAIVMGMYQSGKLYSAGVRPDGGEIRESAGGTALGKAVMAPGAAMADVWKVTDNALSKVVGGKWAAILSGSTFSQAVQKMLGEKLFGTGYQTKDQGIQLGVTGGDIQGYQYQDQKKKGGLISGKSKKRTILSPLDAATQKTVQDSFDTRLDEVFSIFDTLSVDVPESALDGLNMKPWKISLKDNTTDQVNQLVSDFFEVLGNEAVGAISKSMGLGLDTYNVNQLTEFASNLYSINDTFKLLNVNALPVSVWGGKLAEQYVALAGGMEAFSTSTQTYYDAFFSETEKSADTLAAVKKQFADLNVTFPSTREGFRAVVEGLDSTTDAGRSMLLTLMGLSSSASTAYDILKQQAQALTDSASGALQRAISAQKDSINELLTTANTKVSDLTGVSNDLSAALKALRGESDGAVKMLRAQAQATLQNALATARAGGSLSGFEGLSDALNTVSSNNTDLYSTLEDFNRDQGRSAALIDELNTLNGKQLTNAEKTVKALQDQLDRLDDQLAFAQEQIDALNGVDNSVMSVRDAINAMNSAVVGALAGMGGKGATNSAATNGVFIDSVYKDVLGLQGADAAGKNYWLGELANGHISLGQLAQAIANAAKEKNQDVKAGYATGGLISGPGTGTSDSIVARLSNGEYVLTADAVRNYGTGLLDQMNAGQLPAFAAGGGIRLVSNSAPVAAAGSRYNGASGSVAGMAMSGNQQGVIDAINGLQNYLYMITKYSEQTASGVRRQNEMQEAA